MVKADEDDDDEMTRGRCESREVLILRAHVKGITRTNASLLASTWEKILGRLKQALTPGEHRQVMAQFPRPLKPTVDAVPDRAGIDEARDAM